MIELIKGARHCRLYLDKDLFGGVAIEHLVRRTYRNHIGVWKRRYEYNENESEAHKMLFDLEMRYRNKGYTYI